MKQAAIFAWAVILFASCADKGETPTDVANLVYGRVWNARTFEAIGGASVSLTSTSDKNNIFHDTTDGNGNYRFADVLYGMLEIRVEAKNFKIAIASVNHEDKSLRDFALTPDTTNQSP